MLYFCDIILIMDSANNIGGNISSINCQPENGTNHVSNENQLRNDLCFEENMAPLPDDVDIFNFQASWESCKSLLGSMQECTLSIIQQEETQEFEFSECLKYLQNVRSDKFSACSPLDERAVGSDDKK